MDLRIFGLMGDLIEAIGWRILKFSLRGNFEERKVGACRIFGDESSLDRLEDGFRVLSEIDVDLYNQIFKRKIILIGPIKRRSYARQINRRFGIHQWMLEDEVEGVVYGIVVAFFVDTAFEKSGRIKNRLIMKEPIMAYNAAAKWLKLKGFNEVYVAQMEKAGYRQ